MNEYFELDGKRFVPETVELPRRYVGWRCLHTVEGGRYNPTGQPAVRNADNAPNIRFTRDMQWTAYNINEGRLTKAKYHAFYAHGIALTDEQSWWESKDGLTVWHRADHVNGTDLNYADPMLCKGIIMGGGFYTGRQEGVYVVMTPGVDAIDVNKPLPSIEEIIERHWYFHGVTTGEKIYNMPYCGVGVPVLVPYFLSVPVRYPLAWFEKWDRDYLPDPLTIYTVR